MWEMMIFMMIYDYFSIIVVELMCWIMCFMGLIKSC